MRPGLLVLVAGTTTGVGKTWVAARLAGIWRGAGAAVSARKPVQSYAPGEGPTDAHVLAAATGEEPAEVCPPHRWYPAPLAPPIAARALGRPPPVLHDLLAELRWAPGAEVGLVEAVGGPRSPVADDADTAALAAALRPDRVVLVADAALGAINAVLLAVAALPGPEPVVLLNRYRDGDPVHAGNRAWLRERSGLDVVTTVEGLAGRLALTPGGAAGARRGRGSGPSSRRA